MLQTSSGILFAATIQRRTPIVIQAMPSDICAGSSTVTASVRRATVYLWAVLLLAVKVRRGCVSRNALRTM